MVGPTRAVRRPVRIASVRERAQVVRLHPAYGVVHRGTAQRPPVWASTRARQPEARHPLPLFGFNFL